MEGKGSARKKTKLQTSNVDGTNTATLEISSEEKVFSRGELVEEILKHLSPKDQLNCRELNTLWRAEADKLLGKAAECDLARWKFEDDIRLKQLHSKGYFIKHVNFLSRIQTATRFRNTEDIQAFLEQMGDFTGNPFPSRTVIFCVDELNEAKLPEDVKASLTEFVSRFGDEIRNCFAVFKDFEPEREKNVRTLCNFLEKLFQLKNLKFLSLYRKYWMFGLREFMDIFTKWNLSPLPPRLENLKQVQLYGDGSDSILELLINSGSSGQIEILHFHKNHFSFFNFNEEPRPDPLPKLKKLALTSVSDYDKLIGAIGRKLEEFSVSLDDYVDGLDDALYPLRHADQHNWKTLRRISIRTDQYVENDYTKGSNGQERLIDSAKIQYPKLKEVGISHRLLEECPWLLELFAAKFPRWEKLCLYNHTNVCHGNGKVDWIQKNNCLRRYNAFEEICADLWKSLPDSVTTITAEWEKAEKTATRPVSE